MQLREQCNTLRSNTRTGIAFSFSLHWINMLIDHRRRESPYTSGSVVRADIPILTSEWIRVRLAGRGDVLGVQ